MTRSKKGDYYRLRTKKFLQGKGYDVVTVEHKRVIKSRKTGKLIFIKTDLWCSDLIAKNGEQMIFVNSVFGRSNIAAHVKAYLQERWPPFVDLWVAVWEKGDREPEIIDVMEYKTNDIG